MNDLKSLLPSQWPALGPALAVGSDAPRPAEFDLPSGRSATGGHNITDLYSRPTIVEFARHCGCPFAEKEVRDLARVSNENADLDVIIVCMSSGQDATSWFETVGGKDFADPARVKLVQDPQRELYAQFGIGSLGVLGLFGSSVISTLMAFRKQGIINTETKPGSNRWQNSGAFAIAPGGKVKWCHVANHAGDVSDFDAALTALRS